jgi:hypothetical protein
VSLTLLQGDCMDVMRGLSPDSIDACVTDPPYGIGFMGKEWDTFKPDVARMKSALRVIDPEEAAAKREKRAANPNLRGRKVDGAISSSQIAYDYSVTGLRQFQAWTEQWAREAFRVLKPGAHIVVCGAPRAYHRMASGLEDAGFEIRDCLAWLFGQGFPKSLNLGDGLGTALKPAHEPIVLARKPFKGTVKANVSAYGTGGLNISACRIPGATESAARAERGGFELAMQLDGRWPANVALDEIAAMVLDEQSGELHSQDPATRISRSTVQGVTAFGTGESI